MRSVNTLLKRRVAAASKWSCNVCCQLVDEHYEIDHIVPLHLGGSNHRSNLQLLCHQCHKTKTMSEMIARGPWMSIGRCPRCSITFSKYFSHRCHYKHGEPY